tara:strand:+ start:784 stop:1017 length:234 start_codon:yes stop_codon:yes gene_type:complete
LFPQYKNLNTEIIIMLPKIFWGISEYWINRLSAIIANIHNQHKMTEKNREQGTSLHFGGIIERELYYSLIKTNVNGG